ncbi:hypothetical protein GCM10027595_13830 [Corynebacterium nasicanis]
MRRAKPSSARMSRPHQVTGSNGVFAVRFVVIPTDANQAKGAAEPPAVTDPRGIIMTRVTGLRR